MSDSVLNPQQEAFLSYYTNPSSDTFGNALQSALKAKYAKEYAENITALMPDWLLENIGRFNMLKKAERNLDKILDLDTNEGGTLKVVADTSKFVAERLGKREYGMKQDVNVNIEKRVISVDE